MEPYILVRLTLIVWMAFCGVSAAYATFLGEEIGALYSIIGVVTCYALILAIRIQVLEDKLNDKEE